MAPQAIFANFARQENTCASGYQFYSCTFDGNDYKGCCSVDACDQSPVGCPVENQQPGSQQTSAASTTPSSSSKSSSAASSSALRSDAATTTTTTTGSSASSSATDGSSASASLSNAATMSMPPSTPSTTTVILGSGNSGGLSIGVGALAGIIIAVIIATIVGAVCVWLFWTKRRQQQKRRNNNDDDNGADAAMLDGNGSPGSEKLRGGEGSPDSLKQGGFERGQSYLSSTTANSGLVTPGTGNSTTAANLAELHNTPVLELDATVPQRTEGQPVELFALDDAQQARLLRVPNENWHSTAGSDQEPVRATLNSTMTERKSGTYANSWTKFNDVQL